MRNNSSNNTYNNADKGWEKKIENSYASAPYNFIPFPEKVVYRHEIEERSVRRNVKDETEIIIKELVEDGQDILHNSFKEDRKTGYIRYRIEVKTPTFIGDGDGNFFEIDGTPMIPGSTVRGKVRSTAEILSCAYPEFVRDDKLWYRGAFAKGVLKKLYMREVKPDDSKIQDRVKAGYLVKEGKEYKIIAATKDNSGYSFTEVNEGVLRRVARDNKICDGLNREIFMYYPSLYGTKEFIWYKIDILKKEKKIKNKELKLLEKKFNNGERLISEELQNRNRLKREIRDIVDTINNILRDSKIKSFKPYYCNILYDKDNRIIKEIVRKKQDEKYGILMNSDSLNYKQNHYIIYEPDFENYKMISDEVINQFRTSMKCRCKDHIIENFDLPESEGEFKPVFYILDADNNIASFGFTPYLKIPYKKFVCQGIKVRRDKNALGIDYVQGLFGFSNLKYEIKNKEREISYKGRLRFTNARLVGEKDYDKLIHKHLMGPKISSFQLYLNQTSENINNLKTYSDDFELRGSKFYWLKDSEDKRDDYEWSKTKSRDNDINENQFSKLTPIKAKSVFEGKIYFENLSEDELGLLLMSIKPFENAKDNIGQGKPYGFGQVAFKVLEVKEWAIENRFKTFDSVNISKDANELNQYKDKFKQYMENNGCKIDFEEERLKCFYLSRSSVKSSNDEEFKYINFDTKEGKQRYTNREVLKAMKQFIKE